MLAGSNRDGLVHREVADLTRRFVFGHGLKHAERKGRQIRHVDLTSSCMANESALPASALLIFRSVATAICPANVRGSPAKRRAVYRTAYSSGPRRFGRCNRLLAGSNRDGSNYCGVIDLSGRLVFSHGLRIAERRGRHIHHVDLASS